MALQHYMPSLMVLDFQSSSRFEPVRSEDTMHRKIFSLVCMLGLPLASCDPASSPVPSEPIAVRSAMRLSLEGVWQRAEIQLDSGPDAGVHMLDVQPSVYMFSRKHYAVAAVEGFTPRQYLGEESDGCRSRRARLFRTRAKWATYAHESDKLTLVAHRHQGSRRDERGVAAREFDVRWDEIDVWLTSKTPDGVTTRVEADARRRRCPACDDGRAHAGRRLASRRNGRRLGAGSRERTSTTRSPASTSSRRARSSERMFRRSRPGRNSARSPTLEALGQNYRVLRQLSRAPTRCGRTMSSSSRRLSR